MFLFAQLFALMALSHCTYDVGALSRLNVETLKRAPIPLFGRLVCYSAQRGNTCRKESP